MNAAKRLMSSTNGQVTQAGLRTLTSLVLGGMITLGALSIAACGSSQAEKSADPINRAEVENRPGLEEAEQGQFVDSAVAGLFYKTDSMEGFTDHNGYFNYLPDETISFYIGNIALGSATASSIVTPVDISESTDQEINETTVNILRLLQTLDEDGDPSNGISISENTHLAATQINGSDISVTTSSQNFENNAVLIQFIGQVTNVGELVDHDNAVAHFKTTQELLNLQ
ncbi:MAG: hypothetical protein MI867_10945 [Pseudomonadales bacterium]|nr:hypothetical protein [Pseudomonadales bacterium]